MLPQLNVENHPLRTSLLPHIHFFERSKKKPHIHLSMLITVMPPFYYSPPKTICTWQSKLYFMSISVFLVFFFKLSSKIFAAVFHMLRTGQSLELIVASYKLLVDLEKVFDIHMST